MGPVMSERKERLFVAREVYNNQTGVQSVPNLSKVSLRAPLSFHMNSKTAIHRV